MPERIVEAPIEEEMRSAYLDYAMSVIVGRALPDARDGLKPVQRRILYAMRELGLTPDRPFRKSATVVGEVIGKYHPHGDQPVYDALVRMAQDFSLRYPLVQGQGNFGSIDGDPPAAYRYTEARLSRIGLELLRDIDEDTVDFVPNFDGRLKEPTVLPAAFPNLLVNGSSGIAVGMATNIPPHNLGEIVDALVALIEDPQLPDERLFEIVKGPDFPTGGVIVGRRGILEAYRTGRGRIVVRGKYHIEEKRKKVQIVFTEIPYAVSKATIIEQIASLVRNKKLEGIADLRDESDREGLRLVIEVKRGFDPEVLVRQLFKHTALQTTFGAIFLALDHLQPRTLTLRQLMELYLAHREEVVTRRTRFRLRKAEARAHILEGFLKALAHIDEIVALIKASENQEAAKKALMERFGFSEAQAKAILDMRLAALTRLEGDKIRAEYEALLKDIERYKAILSSRQLLLEVIKEELLDIKKRFADPRRTEIAEEEGGDFNIEELIQDEQVVVIVTKGGYVKRIPLREWRTLRKGTKGRSAISTYSDDYPIATKITSSKGFVMFVMSDGSVYWTKAYRLPKTSFSARGKPLATLFKLRGEAEVVDTIAFDPAEDSERSLLILTRGGLVKRVRFSEILKGRQGTPVINLREGDRVADALLVNGGEVIIAKEDGLAARMPVEEIPLRSRRAGAVKGVVSGKAVSLVPVLPEGELITITSRGYGKRFDPEEVRRVHRGSKGVRVQAVNDKVGHLVKLMIASGDEMVLLTKKGVSARIELKRVPKYHRASQGVKIMDVGSGDEIVDAAVIQE